MRDDAVPLGAADGWISVGLMGRLVRFEIGHWPHDIGIVKMLWVARHREIMVDDAELFRNAKRQPVVPCGLEPGEVGITETCLLRIG